MRILDSSVRKIKNSRNEETIEVTLKTKYGTFKASAPEGASKGENEVKGFPIEGVDRAINFISPVLIKLQNNFVHFREFQDLEIIEEEFRKVDKTPDFSLTGGNTLFAIEAAILKALSKTHRNKELWKFLLDEELNNPNNSQTKHKLNAEHNPNNLNIPLYQHRPKMPMQLGNCIGGGKHTKEIEKPDFQEFLFLAKSETFKDSFDINQKAYKEVKNLLRKKDKKFKGKVTDEKAFISSLNNEEIFSIFQEVQEKIKNKLEKTFEIGIDIAASSFYNQKNKKYVYSNLQGQPKQLTKEEQLNYIFQLIKKYNLAYVEDPFNENDFDSFTKLLSKVKKEKLNTLIVGDDLTCTNSKLLKKAISKKSINAVIIKPNQVGSLLETKKTLELAKKNNILPIISNRSGETEDDMLAQLAVGWQIPIIKIAIQGKERLAKTKKLLDIEKKIEKLY